MIYTQVVQKIFLYFYKLNWLEWKGGSFCPMVPGLGLSIQSFSWQREHSYDTVERCQEKENHFHGKSAIIKGNIVALS